MTLPVKVLVVDDSVVIRRTLKQLLETAHDLRVVATPVNGKEALDCLEATSVDVVVLDVEMPVLDGLATLQQLRLRWPKLPVIMFSTLTERGATATLDALALGANDYLTKPSHLRSPQAVRDAIATGLVPLVRSWGRHYQEATRRRASSPGADPAISTARSAGSRRRLHALRAATPAAVVIGSSTGGPNALAELVPALPAALPVPVLVVQHMPAMFTRLLAERLDQRSPLHVCEGADATLVRPGNVYVAPGGVHLALRRTRDGVVLVADDGPPENSVKPAVDVLLRSAVDVWGDRLVSVILTGMGADGLAGCAAVSRAGGLVLAQDEASSVIWGMPGAVANAGLADEVVGLSEMASTIVQAVEGAPRREPT